MTTISAKVVLDSVGIDAPRITTLQLRFPRIILAELNTHRVFSRNARSSRAVPIEKMIAEIEIDPFVPLHWGAAQAGMQAFAECDKKVWLSEGYAPAETREGAWLNARDAAVEHARAFMEAGYAKQLVNRLLEPFMHTDVLVTSTEWANFFELRDNSMAEPHFQMLAKAIREAMAASRPGKLLAGKWHSPYIRSEDWSCRSNASVGFEREMCLASAARCARISYAPFGEADADFDKDVALANKLAASGHWSPFEHIATPDTFDMVRNDWRKKREHRNLTGWRQLRAQMDVREAA